MVIPVIPGALGENRGSTEGETSMEECVGTIMPDDDIVKTVAVKN